MSSNVLEFIETAVEYGAVNLGDSLNAISLKVVKMALRRRFKAQLSLAAWRGYANLILERTKYVGTGVLGTNKAQWRQEFISRADAGEDVGLHGAQDRDVPLSDAFPTGWGDRWGDALD
jgi:hypothetical protein